MPEYARVSAGVLVWTLNFAGGLANPSCPPLPSALGAPLFQRHDVRQFTVCVRPAVDRPSLAAAALADDRGGMGQRAETDTRNRFVNDVVPQQAHLHDDDEQFDRVAGFVEAVELR